MFTSDRSEFFRRVLRRLAFQGPVVVLILAAVLGSVLAWGDGASVAPNASATMTEYARIKTWYSPAFASNNAYVHFKTVDQDGYTAMEVPGSDIINMKQETYFMYQTPKRVSLVNTLRGMMQSAGWVEVGVDGDWYEYVFER